MMYLPCWLIVFCFIAARALPMNETSYHELDHRYHEFDYEKEILDVHFPGYKLERDRFLAELNARSWIRRIPDSLVFSLMGKILEQRTLRAVKDIERMIRQKMQLEDYLQQFVCIHWVMDIVYDQAHGNKTFIIDAIGKNAQGLLRYHAVLRESLGSVSRFNNQCINYLISMRYLHLASTTGQLRNTIEKWEGYHAKYLKLVGKIDHGVAMEVQEGFDGTFRDSLELVSMTAKTISNRLEQIIVGSYANAIELQVLLCFCQTFSNQKKKLLSTNAGFWMHDARSGTLQMYNRRIDPRSGIRDFISSSVNVQDVCNRVSRLLLGLFNEDERKELPSLKSDVLIEDHQSCVQNISLNILGNGERRFRVIFDNELESVIESAWVYDQFSYHLLKKYRVSIGRSASACTDCLVRRDVRALSMAYDDFLLEGVLLTKNIR